MDDCEGSARVTKASEGGELDREDRGEDVPPGRASEAVSSLIPKAKVCYTSSPPTSYNSIASTSTTDTNFLPLVYSDLSVSGNRAKRAKGYPAKSAMEYRPSAVMVSK